MPDSDQPVPSSADSCSCPDGGPGPGRPRWRRRLRQRRSEDLAALKIALIGMPNTGKSTLYNRLTGGNAQIANWPGLTVELLRGAMPADRQGRAYKLVDLPSIHDFSGSSEDEAVVQRFMRNTVMKRSASGLRSTMKACPRRWVCRCCR